MLGIKRFFNTYMYVIFFFLGCFFAGNQLLVHYVAAHFEATELQLSYIIAAMYIGSLAMVLILGEYTEKIGKKPGVVIGAASYCVGALLVALSGSIRLSILSFFLFGCGTGGIEAVLFSLIGDYNGEKTHKVINLSQATFSVGAVSGPLLISRLITVLGYRYIYTIIGAFMGAVVVVFLLSRDIRAFAKDPAPHEHGPAMFGIVRNPAMVVFMLVLMLAIGSETSVTYWLVHYFDQLGAIGLGSLGLSLYWMASIPGRLLGAWIKDQGRYLTYCFLAAGAGILLLLFLPVPVMKFIGIALIGVALAPAYPSISTLGARMFPEKSASAFSLMVFSCGLGGALAQPLIGAVAEYSSIRAVYGGTVIMMVFLAMGIHYGVKISKRRVASPVKGS